MSRSGRRPRPVVVLASLVGALVFVACGDDDDSGAEGTSPTTSAGSTTPGSAGSTTPGPTGATTAPSAGATTAPSAASTAAPSADPTTPSTGGTPSGRVEVLDSGAEGRRIRLPGPAEVGQSAASSVTIDVNLAMEGPGVSEEVPVSMRIDTEAEIVEVTDSGYVAETTITNAELTAGPRGLDPATFEQIAGITFRQRIRPDGTTGKVELVDADQFTNAQRQAFDQFIGQLQSASVAYPSEPVGVGARWQATQAVESQGFPFTITYVYELTSIEGDSYTMDVTYDQDIDDEFEQAGQTARMLGTVTGNGTTAGSIANPLLVNTAVTQDFDVDIESGGEQVEMTMDVRVDLKSSGG
jgi:Family of unknown function (DUF6263)